MLLRIPLNEETFWNEINDVLIACDLVTMWRNAQIETHAVTAVSGIISRFVRCVTKKARNRRKFLPKKRRQQRQQCATKQRELFSYKRRRLQLLTMYFRNCVSQNSSGYRKSTYLHNKPMKIKAKSVSTFGYERYTKQQCDVVNQHLQGSLGEIELSALCFPKICLAVSAKVNVHIYAHLQGLELADASIVEGGGGLGMASR